MQSSLRGTVHCSLDLIGYETERKWRIIMQLFSCVCTILFIPGCFTESMTCTSTVRAPLGGLLSILCNYTEYPTNNKYCCKGEAWDSSCKTIIMTKSSLVEKQGRISINDSQSLHTFIVIIENLTLEDAGKYWCGIDISLSYDRYSPVTVEIFRESLPPTTTIAVTTGYFPAVHIPTKRLSKDITRPPFLNIRLYLPILLLVLLLAFLVGGLLVMWRLKKQKAAKAYGYTLQSTVPSHAEGNLSNATIAINVRPNSKTPSHNSDQDLNGTLHVEYTSVKRPPAPSTQPQVPGTNTEDVSYATIKFPAQDEQAIYANLK